MLRLFCASPVFYHPWFYYCTATCNQDEFLRSVEGEKEKKSSRILLHCEVVRIGRERSQDVPPLVGENRNSVQSLRQFALSVEATVNRCD